MKNIFTSVLVVLALAGSLTARGQVPQLSSLPTAQAVLFLDFDGHTVNGTTWNTNGPIFCGAANFTSTQITTIFNRVAEDYRPFQLNVTTDSTKYFAAPVDKRMRVILTTTHQWYGSAGGVAFVGSFTWGDNTPCFIFTALLNHNVKNVAEATSHEAGHTLGLYHQSTYDANCVKISDYNYGQGTGEIGWAPIMGVGYYQNLTLWNNGPNSFGCTNYQSDLSILTTNNGFGYRNDDHGNTFAAATHVPFNGNSFTINGIVERNTDQDMIRFVQPVAGEFKLDAVPYNVGTGNSGSNLDLQVSIFNEAQVQIATYNPGTLLSSVVDTMLDAGTYFLRVEGRGNVYAPNYASLGSYALTGTFTAGNPLPLRRLELTGNVSGNNHLLNWLIDADEQVVEQVLEISTDGRNFHPLVTPGNADRSYTYQPATTGAAQYRMHVSFDNGKNHYSNIVTLRSKGNTQRPQLLSNIINSNVLTITSPGSFEYAIYDINGKSAGSGRLVTGMNTIAAGGISAGMYLITFSNGDEQWTDKFLRQ
jgi:hypothetical protein